MTRRWGTTVAVLLLTGSAAFAQQQHPPQDLALHERYYLGWMRPDMPHMSCCSGHDCYPTQARWRDGRWEARRREDGVWLAVPEEKIERHRDNPDGRAHLCAPPPEAAALYRSGVICFSAGAGT